MNPFLLTKERIVALVAITIQVACALMFSAVSPSPLIRVGSALGLSLIGLVMIWFREGLSTIAFTRGLPHDSPPFLIDFFGWLFLIGLPIIYLYKLLP